MNKKDFEEVVGYEIEAKVLLTQIEDGEEFHYGMITYDKSDYEDRLDLTKLWQWIEEYAEEMCKKQREICSYKAVDGHGSPVRYDNVMNAPLATEKK